MIIWWRAESGVPSAREVHHDPATLPTKRRPVPDATCHADHLGPLCPHDRRARAVGPGAHPSEDGDAHATGQTARVPDGLAVWDGIFDRFECWPSTTGQRPRGGAGLATGHLGGC